MESRPHWLQMTCGRNKGGARGGSEGGVAADELCISARGKGGARDEVGVGRRRSASPLIRRGVVSEEARQADGRGLPRLC